MWSMNDLMAGLDTLDFMLEMELDARPRDREPE